MERKMAKEYILMQKDKRILASGNKARNMVKALLSNLMEQAMLENGRMIKKMDKAPIHGQMAEFM